MVVSPLLDCSATVSRSLDFQSRELAFKSNLGKVHVFHFILLLFEREYLCMNSFYGLIAVLQNLSREIKVLFDWTGLPGVKHEVL